MRGGSTGSQERGGCNIVGRKQGVCLVAVRS